MKFLASVFPLVPIFISLMLLGCGSPQRTLQSVEVSPATATSAAQFTATGIYNTMPNDVDITSTTTWCLGENGGVCYGNNINLPVQLNAGAARCLQGATGTFAILAGPVSANTPGMGPILKPYGVAQLTCP